MTSFRLPPPFGALVDRERPVAFSFEGRRIEGLAGDTIASALAASGQHLLSRSFKYHRPRGILTMAGQDANSLVQLPHEPNVRADATPVAEGLEVRAQNVSGSLAADRLSVLDRMGRFLPVGFYYRAFFKPAGAFRRWEPVLRRVAGLGALDLKTDHHVHGDKQFLHPDIAVVGAGIAGLAAAAAAAEAGAEVLLVDENPWLGGSGAFEHGLSGHVARLSAAVAGQEGVRVLAGATCTGGFADNWLAVVQGTRLYKVRARQVVLATGAFEQPAVFRNNDLPGVMMGSAAQRLIRLYGVRPGVRAVVLTANEAGYGVALDLAEAGVEVAAVADLRDAPAEGALPAQAAAAGLKVLARHDVVQAEARARRVNAIRLRDRASGAEQRIEADLVTMSVGAMPAFQLAAHRGARLGYDDARAIFHLADLPADTATAGAVNGHFDAENAEEDGRHAGAAAAQAAGFAPVGGVPDAPGPDARPYNHPWPIFPHPKGRDFVDFDEDLQVKDIVKACADGYDELELVKRYSTVGMGPSQGRHSALNTARIVARQTDRSVTEIGVTTARPPFSPEPLVALAGRPFEPVRHTAMHDRHLAAGAEMMPASLWMRPAYYAAPTDRDAAIWREARNVRDNVGLVDVSTLGGLEIRGPDAAEFLARLYTGSFFKLAPGRTRYAIMADEMGSVVDDGVLACVEPEHYYVSATTGGVDRVYRKMLWWNAQWRLAVDVTNATAAFAAVNIAGPKSRDVLATVTDLDLSAGAFPYMGFRLGTVAGIPARVMRVGFVGELGYEIHVPAGLGGPLWDALIAAGAPAGIRPFGVEAQRLLRLEKGHIIIGQDTDALSSIHELDLNWAVARSKPFFVGKWASETLGLRPPRRKLAGFVIDGADAPLPEDSNLVLDGETITGQVTSVNRSVARPAVLGLAQMHPDQAEPGAEIAIKLTDGKRVTARVEALPFYDPDGERQKL